MAERSMTRSAAEKSSTVVVSLSLYLIILAFFILMNAISHPEEELAKGVLDSIGSTFKSFPQTFANSLDLSAGGAGFNDVDGFEDSIREIFESSFPLVRITPSAVYNQLEVTLPVESLFAPGRAKIQGRNEPMLDRLANILSRRTPGLRFELEVLLSSPPLDSDTPRADSALYVERAGAIARELGARGVPPAHISAGVEERDPEWLRFLFIIRLIDEPAAGFAPPPGAAWDGFARAVMVNRR